MAEGGSLAGSDAAYDYNCSECLSRIGTYTEAVFYCSECNKYICKPCYVCDLDVIGCPNMDRWGHPSKRAKFDPCQKHKGQLLQLFCRKHDVVCCPSCSKSDHKSCDIPLVTNGNKAGLKKVEEGLGELHLKADKVSKDKAINLTDLDQTEQRLTTNIKQFRVDALLDDMEKKSLDDIEVETLFKDRCKSELDICGKIKTEVNDLEMELDSASTDDSLLFSRIKQGKGQVRDKNSFLSDKTSSESSEKANCKQHTEREHLLMRLQGLNELHTDSSVDIPPSPGSGEVKHGYNQGLDELHTDSSVDIPPSPGSGEVKHGYNQGLDELHTDSSVDIPPSPGSGEVKHGYNQGLDELHTDSSVNGPPSPGSGEVKHGYNQGLDELHTDSSVNGPPSPGSGEVKHGYNQGLVSQTVTANKSYRTVKKTSFDVKTENDKNTCDIWGMCMMPSGHLILADYYNKSLKKVSSQYEVTGRCPMSAAPRDVCHTEADQVAVALYSYTVQLVTVSGSMSCTSSFSTDHACHSLAYSNKCLFIITYRGTAVYVYNLAGTQLRVITLDQHGNQQFSDTRCITTSRDGERLHITDEKGLITMDTRGNLITRFTSDELIDGPFSLCTDKDGNVFVGGRSSSNVLQVGGEADKKLAELLSHSDGIEVQSLCFDGAHDRLLVASWDSDTVHVLHLST